MDNRLKAGRPDVTFSIKELKDFYSKSTQVVGWYAHPAEVRGPFCRWLTVSEVSPEYQEKVSSRADDARYAAAAMNMVPHLIDALETLEARFERFISTMSNINAHMGYQFSRPVLAERMWLKEFAEGTDKPCPGPKEGGG